MERTVISSGDRKLMWSPAPWYISRDAVDEQDGAAVTQRPRTICSFGLRARRREWPGARAAMMAAMTKNRT